MRNLRRLSLALQTLMAAMVAKPTVGSLSHTVSTISVNDRLHPLWTGYLQAGAALALGHLPLTGNTVVDLGEATASGTD